MSRAIFFGVDLCKNWGLQISSLLESLADRVILGKYTALVGLELATCVEVDKDRAACPDFLDHVLFAHTSVESRAHVVGVFDAGDFGAVGPLTTAFRVSGRLVLGACGINGSILLQEHAIEEAPTTVASLIDKVAIKTLLGGQGDVLAVPDLNSRL